MNVLIFTDADAQKLIEYQSGQHRLGPVKLTDGRWFLMADVLTEMPEGLFKDKLDGIEYTVESLENIRALIPVFEDIYQD